MKTKTKEDKEIELELSRDIQYLIKNNKQAKSIIDSLTKPKKKYSFVEGPTRAEMKRLNMKDRERSER
jgi:hypothetical protein